MYRRDKSVHRRVIEDRAINRSVGKERLIMRSIGRGMSVGRGITTGRIMRGLEERGVRDRGGTRMREIETEIIVD